MTENATPAATESVKPVQKLTFEEALDVVKGMGIPDAGLQPLRDAWANALNLINENNKRILQINSSKATDPAKPGYVDELDKIWAVHAPNDEKFKGIEEQLQAHVEAAEKLRTQLREFAKTKVQPPLSSEELAKAKKFVTESESTIKVAREAAGNMAMMVDGMLTAAGKGIEGGLISLLPDPDTLKNLRGRKAGSSTRGPNMTRIGKFWIDGVAVEKDGKTNFTRGAEELSKQFGSVTFPENKVTAEDVETAFYEAIGAPYRSKSQNEIPESTTFEFVKEVRTSDSTTETRSVQITIGRKMDDAKAEAPAEKVDAEKKVDAPAEKAEEPKVTEEPKAEVPAPAKKSAPAKK